MPAGPSAAPGQRRALDTRGAITAGVAVLALLAYVPGLVTAHGILPADTKLYLSVDPGRLMASAASLWDNSQFGGWVTHQMVGYLWPTGPWYWVIEHLGGPAWLAQRLFVGTVFLAAGTGVWWCCRRLGLAHRGAWAAAVVYQLSPYVLAYSSRTSVLLSPWAGLGWLVGLTVLAARRGGWRYPALFAFVVATVGGINATAIALIAIAPVLWLVQAAWGAREITTRRAVAVALRLGVLSFLLSLWWLVPLMFESRYGADVLAYSETVSAVSSTSLGSEVLRGLGYWLFYGGDITGRWTSASTPYLQSPALIGLGFLLAALGVAGILLIRWRYRAYLAALVVVGTVISVGAYGLSPLARALKASDRSTLVLALRSSTRAVPVLLLGLAIGVGALITACRPRLPRATLAATAAVGVLAVVNLPSLWNGNIVDATLRHPEEMPAWWHEAADTAGAAGATTRVLELPGAEFAAHRWGQTNDPVLPGLTGRPTIARDLLPLGSPALMDLLYALDDRFQEGVAERASIAPVARLLGAGDILFRGDTAFDKYQNPRPGETWGLYDTASGADGLGRPTTFGPDRPNLPAVPMIDETSLSSAAAGQAVPQLALVPVEDAQPMVRAASGQRAVVLAGSGAGVVDAAAAGLLDGTELLRYAADVDGAADGAVGGSVPVPPGALLVVTDSNRKQAHQWRGSQDVTGFTEDEGPGLLDDDEADHRLPVFGPDGGGPEEQTLAQQRGPIRASASAYGTPDSYRPEDRAYHAIDADPTTAWSVGADADAIGQRIRLDLAGPRDLRSVRLVQPLTLGNRRITEVRLTTAAGSRQAALGPTSSTPAGQAVELPPGPSSWLEIEITGVTGGRVVDYTGLDPVGFSTVDLDGLTAREVVRPPTALLAELGTASLDHPLAYVLTRDRVDARKRWRDDPEAALVRDIATPTGRAFRLTGLAHLAPRAADAVLDQVVPQQGQLRAEASSRLAGVPTAGGRAAVDGNPATAWQTAFGPAAGATLTVTEPRATTIDHLDLRLLADGDHSVPTSLTISNGRERRTVTVPPLADRTGSAPASATVRFAPLMGSTFTVTIGSTRDVTTFDRQSGKTVTLPVGVAEIGLPMPATTGAVAAASAAGQPILHSGECRTDLLTVDGRPVPVRVEGTRAAALAGDGLDVVACGPLRLGPGDHLLQASPGTRTGLDLDRVALTSAGGGSAAAPGPVLAPSRADGPTAKVTSSDRTHRHVLVSGGDGPVWLTSGEGLNAGWHATVDGTDLGPPQPVDGGMNGWRVPRTGAQPVEVALTWTPQRAVWVSYVLSALGAVLCLVIVVAGRRRTPGTAVPEPIDAPAIRSLRSGRPSPKPGDERGRLPWGPLAGASALVAILTAVVFSPIAAPIVAAAMLLAGRVKRARLLCALISLGAVAATGLFYVVRQWRTRPHEGFGWPSRFHLGHPAALTAIVFLAADVALTALEQRARRAGSGLSAQDRPATAPTAASPGAAGRE